MPNFARTILKNFFTKITKSWYVYDESNDLRLVQIRLDLLTAFIKINMIFVKKETGFF